MGLTRDLAAYLADPASLRVDDALRETVSNAVVDTAACILSGRDEPVTRIAIGWSERALAQRPEATRLFGEVRRSVVAAAFVNSVSGHALDYDDVALSGHPSVVLVPALWAEHEAGGIRGEVLIEAYAKGYEVWAELHRRLPTPLHEKGWHPTAVFGTPAVAAALGVARRLPAPTLEHVLGIAASAASGLVSNFGSMTKPLHAGWAAARGIEAVDLAEAGATASPDAIEHRAGLLAALAAGVPPDRESAFDRDRPPTLAMLRPAVKKYPVCYAAHRLIDGVLDLRARHGLASTDVAGIVATIGATGSRILKNHDPRDALEAKFSLEFCCAAPLVRGGLGLAEVDDETVRHPEVRRLIAATRIELVDTQCPIEPGFAWADRVRLELHSGGSVDSGDIRFARGHSQLPLAPGELRRKLAGCVRASESALAEQVMASVERVLRA